MDFKELTYPASKNSFCSTPSQKLNDWLGEFKFDDLENSIDKKTTNNDIETNPKIPQNVFVYFHPFKGLSRDSKKPSKAFLKVVYEALRAL